MSLEESQFPAEICQDFKKFPGLSTKHFRAIVILREISQYLSIVENILYHGVDSSTLSEFY